MKKERIESAVFVLLACAAVVGGLFAYTHKDLTGTPYTEISAYMEANPHKRVTYSVTIDGGETPLILSGDTTCTELTTPAQAEDLAAKKDYFPHMEVIDLGSTHISSSASTNGSTCSCTCSSSYRRNKSKRSYAGNNR